MWPADPGPMLPRLNSRTPECPARFRDSTTLAANGRSFNAISNGSIRVVSDSAAACGERCPRAVNSARPTPPSDSVAAPLLLERRAGALSAPADREVGLTRLRGAATATGPARRRLTSMWRFLAMVFCGFSWSARSSAAVASSSCPSSRQHRPRRVHAPWFDGDSVVISSLTERASGPKSPRFAKSMACCSSEAR